MVVCGCGLLVCSVIVYSHYILRMSMRLARLAYLYAVGAGSIGGGGQ